MKPIKEGKVREIYELPEALVLVATDRISCFDVILHNMISGKGKVLTQISKFWFNFTSDLVPNHMISTDTADMPEDFQTPDYEGRSMMVKKLTMLPVECIVRGYITGSGWKSYVKDGTVCGIKLPEGLKECAKLSEPIYTPSTKADLGDHDENISFEQSVAYLEESTKSALTTPSKRESSSLIPNLSSDSMKTAISFWATRCSLPIPAASGPWTAMSPARASPPLTNSWPGIIFLPIPNATTPCLRRSSIRPSPSTWTATAVSPVKS